MDMQPPPPTVPPSESLTPENGPENEAKNKRVNQACLICRRRKSKCHLDYKDGKAQLPCQRCKRESLECVLGGSNRGGRRVRKKPLPQIGDAHQASSGVFSVPPPPPPPAAGESNSVGFHGLGTIGTTTNGSPTEQRLNFRTIETNNARPPPETAPQSTGTNPMEFDNLQNPSDALGILARVAEEDTPAAAQDPTPMRAMLPETTPRSSYRLLAEGKLTLNDLVQLIQRYRTCYHPYFPLAPPHAFDVSNLIDFAHKEPHLLTAILVIASKDLAEEMHLYESASEFMKILMSDLAAGGNGGVEAVEALLLLAEWAPFTQRVHVGKIGKGEEDREAWNSSGLAIRLAYYMGLERYSFKIINDGKDPQFNRKLLVWTACYIADRQISIRIGKAFWSRGPGPLTTLRRENYPYLLPQRPNEEDYASIFQATLELTSLFGNAHDVLYSNVGTSFRSNLSGSYVKFIDDFRAAAYGWKAVWGCLSCSPNLKAMLVMSYDYLRLYVNAFAFQATVRRVQAKLAEDKASSPIIPQSPSRVFYNNVGAVGDARFIFEALDAAKAILTTANSFIPAETALRFMPLRFYLYLVYGAVFLFRAKIVGVFAGDEERLIRRLIDETIEKLQRSAVGPQHMGARYAELLKLLWQKADTHKPPGYMRSSGHSQYQQYGEGGGGVSQTTPAPSACSGSGAVGESPLGGNDNGATAEQLGDFSWTDLNTIGEFATSQGQLTDDALWSGFLPLEVDFAQFDADMGMGF
ncbi:uncharacterized protein J3D65DRAFT_645916 [Phyllosticta citribraziliensis]|uniref:Zn(2)-C6 fungal-type domain-containing protein n=1 Tax=Phyllosticta citribraziliensis TaxID=989973 RepID=A0ABR1LPS3_9PEZI